KSSLRKTLPHTRRGLCFDGVGDVVVRATMPNGRRKGRARRRLRMSWLNGRVLFITGGASGLGREVALQSAGLGAKVAIMDTHTERLEATCTDVAAIAGDCLARASDVTNEADVSETIQDIVAKWGQLDTVVNSAGVYYRGPITTTPMEDFDR